MNPATFLRVLGPEPWNVAYQEPSIRPDDSRYGENPNRLQRHTQFQVILKPAPSDPQELVVASYRALGIDVCKMDIRFVEDNWESPALGAWGLGWEIWLNGMEVTQFTYFQQAGGEGLDTVSVEITYGLERIIMALQGKTHFKDVSFGNHLSYGELFYQTELEMSKYYLDHADVERNFNLFQLYEEEANMLIELRLPVPAYNYLLKASHTFNVLDSRGAIGVTERARYFQRMRALSRSVAQLWVKTRADQNFPLLKPRVPSPPILSVCPPSIDTPITDFVLEIGVEELPAGDVQDISKQVHKLLLRILSDANLMYSSLDVSASPRRVGVIVRDLQTRQKDECKRIRGPPLKAALKDGKATKAALGFMRSQGVTQDAVEYDETEGYMYATVDRIGRGAADVLAEMIPTAMLGKLSFGKSMRWNDTGVAFSRPVRWLVCLLGKHVVPLQFAGVTSGRMTRSLRGPDGYARNVLISSAQAYQVTLESLQIVLSRDQRSQHIRLQSMQLASEIGGTIPDEYLQGSLLEEVTDLVENPLPLTGRFDKEFLSLPDAVLITVMKKHQRYFPIVDQTGKLINGFITVANGDSGLVDIDAIRHGNEAVLRARYSDAAFFYNKDTSKKLEEFLPSLGGLTFQDRLGSMLDKVKRVEKATLRLCEHLGLSDFDENIAVQASRLYKADLGTSMVVEMTSLAGTVGKHYAQKSGMAAEVCEAIFEACLPRFSGDAVAKSSSGAVVAVADRVDSLVGLFSAGLMPKATADPFALRRAALGCVQTMIENGFSADIKDIVDICAKEYEGQNVSISNEAGDNVVAFVAKRLEGYLLDTLAIRDDIVKSVLGMAESASNPVSAARSCLVLGKLISEERDCVTRAQEAHMRASRLISSVKGYSVSQLSSEDVDESLFEGEEEQALWKALESMECSDLQTSIESLARIGQDVDAFFDGVFVNAEDEALRRNRLAMVAKVVNVVGRFIKIEELRL